LPYIGYFDKFIQISYLNQIPNNKKAWRIRKLAGKHPDNYSKYAFPYEFCADVLENYKYGDEFVGISYSSKYSKHSKGLPKDMQRFYIHRGLLWVL
jgi:hypothetical protein